MQSAHEERGERVVFEAHAVLRTPARRAMPSRRNSTSFASRPACYAAGSRRYSGFGHVIVGDREVPDER
jgi:hypothetical protein